MNGKEFRGPLAVAIMGIVPWTLVTAFWLFKTWTADSFDNWVQFAVFGVASILCLGAISIPPPWIYGTHVILALRNIVVIALLVSLIRVWPENPSLLTLLSLIIAAGGLVIAVRFAARSTADEVLDLHHPVPATLIANQAGRFGNHHKSAIEQRWAADLSALGPGNRRASPIWSSRVDDYAIFGLPVHAPCDGVVVDCADGRPDNIDLNEVPRYTDGRGNFIAIATDGATVILAHLKLDSVVVEIGDPVSVGQILARVGNSGRTSEPHLHLHCEADGKGVPFTINGQRLFRGVRLRQR
ncbi:M23 family metallopeptidase [Gordonia sp. CPCC 205333]|uniref:M23 family metallopeptidase n=1 Tax=Gordonia sp. CPCC 205333 TaxID=3140790 RepID=UPI003AF3628D